MINDLISTCIELCGAIYDPRPSGLNFLLREFALHLNSTKAFWTYLCIDGVELVYIEEAAEPDALRGAARQLGHVLAQLKNPVRHLRPQENLDQ